MNPDGTTNPTITNEASVVFEQERGFIVPSSFIKISGNEIPWDSTVCLTPQEEIPLVAICPEPELSENGVVYFNCDYTKFTLEYSVQNRGTVGLENRGHNYDYFNELEYDGNVVRRTHVHTTQAMLRTLAYFCLYCAPLIVACTNTQTPTTACTRHACTP